MGRYASHLWLRSLGGLPSAVAPGSQCLIVARSAPDPAVIEGLLPDAVNALVLGCARGVGSGRVCFAPLDPDDPAKLPPEVESFLEGTPNSVLLLETLSASSGRLLWRLFRAGAERIFWAGPGGWRGGRAGFVIAAKALHRGALRVRARLGRGGPWAAGLLMRLEAGRAQLRFRTLCRLWGEALKRPQPAPPAAGASSASVTIYVGSLNSGGAERQASNLAIALHQRGFRTRLLTTWPLEGADAHYAEPLRAAGVEVRDAGSHWDEAAHGELRRRARDSVLLRTIPAEIRDAVLDLAGELLAAPPDVLHCFLDFPNVIGGVAGMLTDTPRVVLSTRNCNPHHFPGFYRTWMDPWYRLLARVPGVRFTANSRLGAEDYARWIHIPADRFRLIQNAVLLPDREPLSEGERADLRRCLGLPPQGLLVAGVFRLAEEKRPTAFLEIVRRVHAELPNLRAVVVGIGHLEREVRAAASRLGLDAVVRLLGQRDDVDQILRASDAMLLASRYEGTPNVVLEAQWVGCPVVATAVGGTPQIVEDGETGFTHAPDDLDGLAKSLVRLLTDPTLRSRVSARARRSVRGRHCIDRVVSDTIAHYDLQASSHP